jgi:hypothetical protein
MKKAMMFFMALSLVFVFGTTCYADSYETEPNNDKAQADALTSDVPIVGQCSNQLYDDDWFYICTSGADLIETSFYVPDRAGGHWFISIEDVHGNMLSEVIHRDSLSVDTVSEFATAVSSAGIYYIKIHNGSETNSYSLTASISNPGECPAEPSEYDLTGIWRVVGQDYYFSFYVSGSTVIIVTFVPGHGEGYMTGNISGNTGYITYASDLSQFNATFTATSATAGTLTVNTCVPLSGEYCLLPAGATVNVVKMF